MKWFLPFLVLLGLFDSGYLAWEHFTNNLPPCSVERFAWLDCGTVLRSEYAYLFGVPLAMWGVVHYGVLLIWVLMQHTTWARKLIVGQTLVGFLMSLYFIYLQLGILGVVCGYCMVSAISSILLFLFVWLRLRDDRAGLVGEVFGVVYRTVVKRILFLFDPEVVHTLMVRTGEFGYKIPGVSFLTRFLFLPTSRLGIVGLAAGFDYEARLTGVLPAWGFGFQTVGTITNLAWEGNAQPRLGRLPKSKSLLVNKGFRNPGADAIISLLAGRKFGNRVGVSIGDPKGDINGIVSAFVKFEQSGVAHSYYELNISCPNLDAARSLYALPRLRELLVKLDRLKLKRPVYVKMPIEKTDKEFLALLKEISAHSIAGIVVGNLQKDRSDPSFDPEEIAQAGKGNFSGKPTFERSNHFIRLAYKSFGKKLKIIGCGGVFSVEDAFEKIKNGASQIQLISGMIFQGPQLAAQIELQLPLVLKKHGFMALADAVGSSV